MAVKDRLFGGHVGFVSLADACLDGHAVAVPYTKAKIKGAHTPSRRPACQPYRRQT